MDLKSEVLTKSKKNRHFAKELVHGFCQKIDLFSYVFLSRKGQKETFFYILDRKECHLDLKSEVLTKSKNIVILEGVSPWFLSKNRPFFYVYFLTKKANKDIFWYSEKEIKLFGPQKWSSHKVEKNRHFAKGLVQGVRQKIDLFLICFFFSKQSQKETVFYILESKECFLHLKS